MEALRVDEKRYPHTLVAEVLSETGVILGGFFLLVLLWVLNNVWKRMDTHAPLTPVLRALLTFTAVAVLFSGDLEDSRILILALAIGEAGTASAVPAPRTSPASKGLG